MKRPLSWARISRSLVVSALVDILEQEAWCSKAPFIVAVE
jgi:hypothetical protein